MTLKFLLEKEFRQFFRNPLMPRMVFIYPLAVMFVMPWTLTMDIKNLRVSVVDDDRSPVSGELVRKIGNSTYFDITSHADGFDTAMREVEYGNADLVVEIPAGFESDLVNLGTAPVRISVNAVNGIKGMLGQSYMGSLIAEFSRAQTSGGFAAPAHTTSQPTVDVRVKNMFNPTLDFRRNSIPALIMMIMVVLCAFLPAVNIVLEKEQGTIEQINVTPVRKPVFILAKLIPFWVFGFVAVSVAFLLSWLIYGVVPAGSFANLYLFCGLFILTMTGAGLVVSNYSSTMQQATFLMFFFVVIFILMSGLLTPVSSMPDWAQTISSATPTRYIVDALRSIYIKGATFSDLRTEALTLMVMMLGFNAWAVLSYRKTT